tara:strand:- start:401 stop:1033 length:633 start_codon:yes stop_codon:yes gene_type:complete
MCDPTVGAALTKNVLPSILAQGAGIILQNRATNKANALQALRLQQNRERNKALTDAQAAAINDTVNAIAANTGKQGMQSAGNELSEILKAAITRRNAPVTASDRSAPKVFMDENQAAEAAAIMQAKMDADNIAKLDATNRFLTESIAPKIADSAATGMLTGNFVRGNANVLDTGMRAAGQLAYSPMAQILQGTGKVGLGYSLYDPDKKVT